MILIPKSPTSSGSHAFFQLTSAIFLFFIASPLKEFSF